MSSFDDAMELWVKAGGSPQAAAMAAAVADASSGLNPNSSFTDTEGIVHNGLWSIPATQGALATTDPMANARAAIQLSDNGTDWSKWCSSWSDNDCGRSGGTYLGDGSNALASLAQRGGTYNVIGGQGLVQAVPTGVNPATYGDQPADTSTSDTTSTPSTTSHSGFLLAAVVLLLLGVLAYFYMRRERNDAADDDLAAE